MSRILLASVAMLILLVQGCTLTAGKSAAEIQTEHSSPAYVDRSFNDMQPDLP